MKKFIFCFLALQQSLTYTVNPRSFGEHDPLDTKAAFYEMMQNHTGTKTEMLYRTAGLFSILDVCRKKPKEVEKDDWDEHILNRFLVKKIEYKENHVQALPTEKKQAYKHLEETFKEARKVYKGTSSYRISKFLYISNEDCKPGTIASCLTVLGIARISINPKSNTLTTYFDRFASDINMKNLAKKSDEQVAQVIADPKVSFFKKTILKCILGIVHFGSRCSEDLVRSRQEQIQDTLFHELSHPYTNAMGNHIRKHRLPGESTNIAVEEAYANTLAVFNSPRPLRTAKNLDDGYHSAHLAALAKSLKKEGVRE